MQALAITKLPDFYFALGSAYLSLPDLGQAEQVLREGLDQAIQEMDEKQQAHFSILLGQVLLAKGDLDGALRYSERALKTLENTLGKNNPTTKIGAVNLANIKRMMGN